MHRGAPSRVRTVWPGCVLAVWSGCARAVWSGRVRVMWSRGRRGRPHRPDALMVDELAHRVRDRRFIGPRTGAAGRRGPAHRRDHARRRPRAPATFARRPLRPTLDRPAAASTATPTRSGGPSTGTSRGEPAGAASRTGWQAASVHSLARRNRARPNAVKPHRCPCLAWRGRTSLCRPDRASGEAMRTAPQVGSTAATSAGERAHRRTMLRDTAIRPHLPSSSPGPFPRPAG